MHAIIGRIVKDTITGFTGTAIGHGEFLGGEETLIQPPATGDGTLPTAQWFRDERVQIVATSAPV